MALLSPGASTGSGLPTVTSGRGLNELTFSGNTYGNVAGTNYQSTVWGSPIALSQGVRKVTGVPIWASEPRKTYDAVQQVSDPLVTVTSQEGYWKRDFAVSLGKRLDQNNTLAAPLVRRVWVDGQLVYSDGVSQPYTYNSITQNYDKIFTNTGDAQLAALVPPKLQSAIKFRFYNGSETQVADSLIIADQGDLAPAYRGLIYMVIEDFTVGKWSSFRNYANVPMDSGWQWGSGDVSVVAPLAVPVIEVELADGTVTVSTAADFTMDKTVPGLFYPTNIIMSDWVNRQLLTISGGSVTPYLHKYDIDSRTETSALFINGLSGGQWGSQQFMVWDTFNNICYSTCTVGATNYCVAALDIATATVLSTGPDQGSNLGPFDVSNNSCYTSGNDAVKFPSFEVGDIGYCFEGGAPKPVIFAQGNFEHSIAIIAPTPSGQVPATFPRDSFFQHSASLQSVLAIPLWVDAQKNGVQYQDCAFVTTSGNACVVYYVHVFDNGSQRYGKVLGQVTVYTDPDATRTLAAQLDSNNNIVLWSSRPGGGNNQITKLRVSIQMTPDYNEAPGWRGMYPKVNAPLALGDGTTTTAPIYAQADLGVSLTVDRNTLRNSNVARDTMLIGTTLVNLADASVQSHTEFSTAGSDKDVWDSSSDCLFFSGNISGYTSVGMRYQFASAGINNTLQPLSTYLTLLALAGGYTNSQISVDTTLKDPVVGVYITHPYDLNTLFNDLSIIYDFIYYESGGVVKFARSSRNPEKAAATYTMNANMTDGETVTLGSVVYTYRNTLAAPFDVKIGADAATTLGNLVAAIDLTGSFGTEYATGTLKNDKATAQKTDASHAVMTAAQGGLAGNSVVSTTTGLNHSFDQAHLHGGAEPPPPNYDLTIDNMAPINEGAATENEVLITTISPPTANMRAATLNYVSLEQNYQPASQTYNPDNLAGSQLTGSLTQSYALPFVMSGSEAYSRVSKVSLRQGDNQIVQEFRLPPKFLRLEPSDVISITIAPFQYVVRVDEVTINGDFSQSYSGFNYSFRDDVIVPGQLNLGQITQLLPGAGDATPLVIDGPIIDPLQGSVPGELVIVTAVMTYGQPNWQAATMMNGLASGLLTQLYTATVDAPWGTMYGTLADTTTPYMTDNDTVLTVTGRSASSADWASVSTADFLAGKNLVAIGDHGRWEYVYFRDVTVVSSTVVKLTGLLRGMRGTDYLTGTHKAGDRVVLLRSAAAGFVQPTQLQGMPVSEVTKTYRWKALGIPQQRVAVPDDEVIIGGSLKPFTVAAPKAVNSAGDIVLTWKRRDRLGTEFVTKPQVLSETSEHYDLEIMNGTTVVRTVAGLTSPSYTYTAANQTADGFATPMTTIKVRVYQIGELGRGFTKDMTLNVE